MNRTLAVLAMAVALAGCGHDVYERSGTTQAQYIQDENACLVYADQQAPAAVGYVQGGYSLNVEKKRSEIRSCMEGKGYILAPKWPIGPYGNSPTTGPSPADMPLGIRR